MNYPADAARRCALHLIKRVLRCLSGVNDDRKPGLRRQIQLASKPNLLYVPRRFLVMVLQSDFTDCNHLRMFREFRKVLEHRFVQFLDIVRMRAERRIYPRVTLCELKPRITRFNRSARVNDLPDTVFFQVFKQHIPVRIKGFVVIVCVCI